MGVTIHFEGSTTDINKAKETIAYATFFAESLGWEVRPFQEKVLVYVEKLRMMGGKTFKWVTRTNLEVAKSWGWKKPKEDEEISEEFGVVINPTKPFNTESIRISFWKYKNKYYIKDFCKTQVFSENEKANLIAHQLIITMLLTIKYTWIGNLKITDEGDFFLPLTYEERERIIKENIREEYWEEYMKKKPFDFTNLVKAHAGNLKVINLVAGTLFELGYDVETPTFSIRHKKEDE